MTLDEVQWLLKNIKQPCVKIRGTEGRASSKQHPMPALLIGLIGNNRAAVKPFGHKKEEIVEIESLSKWKSRMPEDMPEFGKHITLKPNPLTQTLGDKILKANEQNQRLTARGLPHGLPKEEYFKNKWTQANWDECRKLKRMGKNWDEIAVITGMPRGTVYQKLQKEFPSQRYITDEIVEKVIAMREQGLIWEKIGEELGYSGGGIRLKVQPIIEKLEAKKRRESQKAAREGVAVLVAAPEPVTALPQPTIMASAAPAPAPTPEPARPSVSKATLLSAIRQIISLPIPDTSKLLAIEGLVSHE